MVSNTTALLLAGCASLSIFFGRKTARDKAPQMLATVMDLYGYTKPQQTALMALLRIYRNRPPRVFDNLEGANTWFKDATQGFLRRGERWDPKNVALDAMLAPHHTELLAACDTLGMISEEKPLIKTPYIIVPGALDIRVEKRIQALASGIIEETLSPTATILFLTCKERVLRDGECPELTDNRTEKGMAEYLWIRAKEKHPALKTLQARFISGTPKDGKTRADTEDTAIAMRETLDDPKSAMTVIIEQPYKNRFESTFQRTNPNTFHYFAEGLDTQAAGFRPFILPDNIGRDIYGMYSHVAQMCQEMDQGVQLTS
jgi:hypothetical protein